MLTKLYATPEEFIQEMINDKILHETKVIRVIKYFPKKGNGDSKKALLYNKNGYVIGCYVATYTSFIELENQLNKVTDGVIIIHDQNYMQRKSDFDYFG